MPANLLSLASATLPLLTLEVSPGVEWFEEGKYDLRASPALGIG